MRFLRKAWSWLLLPAAAFSLFLNPALGAIEASGQSGRQPDEVELAKIQAGGKIVLVSSGARNGGFRAIDDDHRTTFQFSQSDSRPTLIIKLFESRPIHRVTVLPGSNGGKKVVDVYLLNDLPHRSSDLDNLKPVGSILDLGIGREAGVEFAPQNARYIALRWTLSGTNSGMLDLAEVSAFGRGDSPVISAALADANPPIYLVEGPPVLPPVSH